MPMRVAEGTYVAFPVKSEFGFTNGGKEQVRVDFEISEGEFTNYTLPWFGYFTDKTRTRTLETLRLLGWRGNDLTKLDGIGTRKVEIVVEDDTYQGKTKPKIQYVNPLGGGTRSKSVMSPEQLRAFADKMRAVAQGVNELPAPEREPGADDDDVRF